MSEKICAITLAPIEIGGELTSGSTYEYFAIKDWLFNHDTDPLTNLKLTEKNIKRVYLNPDLKIQYKCSTCSYEMKFNTTICYNCIRKEKADKKTNEIIINKDIFKFIENLIIKNVSKDIKGSVNKLYEILITLDAYLSCEQARSLINLIPNLEDHFIYYHVIYPFVVDYWNLSSKYDSIGACYYGRGKQDDIYRGPCPDELTREFLWKPFKNANGSYFFEEQINLHFSKNIKNPNS